MKFNEENYFLRDEIDWGRLLVNQMQKVPINLWVPLGEHKRFHQK